MPLAFSYDPAVIVTASSQYAAFSHGPYLCSKMLGWFSANTLPCIAQTSNLFADAMLSELYVAGLRPASTPLLNSVRIIPIMGLDAPAEFVSSLSRIKNSFIILAGKVAGKGVGK